jgi:hypothetical protein
MAKQGISSRKIRRMFFGGNSSLRTAWYVGHRLRAGMRDDGFKQPIGIGEVDETYIGGKDATAIGLRSHAGNKNLRARKSLAARSAMTRPSSSEPLSARATSAAGSLDRPMRARWPDSFRHVVNEKVPLAAAENQGYNYLGRGTRHASVKQAQGEYLRGEVHKNNIESFWGLLKRGIIETYRNVSKKYLCSI